GAVADADHGVGHVLDRHVVELPIEQLAEELLRLADVGRHQLAVHERIAHDAFSSRSETLKANRRIADGDPAVWITTVIAAYCGGGPGGGPPACCPPSSNGVMRRTVTRRLRRSGASVGILRYCSP